MFTNFLIRRLVKNSEKTADPDVRAAYGRAAGRVGIFCNLLLGIGKMISGLIVSSISVLADGINNLSDAVSSLVTLICFRISSVPADKKHPFGHARMEYISGLVVAVLILMVGLELGGSSIEKIFHPQETPFSWLTVGILAASILVKCWLAAFNLKISRKIDSSALKATAADSRNDVIATSSVLLSLFLAKWTHLHLDGWMGLLIAVFIFCSGIGLIGETLSPLLGEAPDPDQAKKAAEKIRSYPGVLGIHDLMVHDYGPGRRFATVHLEVDAHRDIMESHDLCDRIERDFVKNGVHLVVHMDPVITDDPELNRLRKQTEQILAEMEPDISMHDFRITRGYSHTNVIFDIAVPYSCKRSSDSLRQELQEKIAHLEPEGHYFAVIDVDRNYTELS